MATVTAAPTKATHEIQIALDRGVVVPHIPASMNVGQTVHYSARTALSPFCLWTTVRRLSMPAVMTYR